MFSNSSPYHLEALKFMLKFRHYEKTAKYEKNLQSVLKKQLFLLSSVKTSERFFSKFSGLFRKAGLHLRSSQKLTKSSLSIGHYVGRRI